MSGKPMRSTTCSNQCPKCNGETVVVDSRVRKTVPYLYRRRVCLNCKHRFSTYEIGCKELMEILKQNASVETYIKVKKDLLEEFEGEKIDT